MCFSCPAVDLAPRVWVAAKTIASSISTRIHFCVICPTKGTLPELESGNYLFLQHRNPAALNRVQYISTRLQRKAFKNPESGDDFLFLLFCGVV